MANSAAKKAAQSNQKYMMMANIGFLVVTAFHLLFRYLIRDLSTVSRWTIVRSCVFISLFVFINRYFARVSRPKSDTNGKLMYLDLSDPRYSLSWDCYYILASVLILSPASERVYWLTIFIPVLIFYQLYQSIIKPARQAKAMQKEALQNSQQEPQKPKRKIVTKRVH